MTANRENSASARGTIGSLMTRPNKPATGRCRGQGKNDRLSPGLRPRFSAAAASKLSDFSVHMPHTPTSPCVFLSLDNHFPSCLPMECVPFPQLSVIAQTFYFREDSHCEPSFNLFLVYRRAPGTSQVSHTHTTACKSHQ